MYLFISFIIISFLFCPFELRLITLIFFFFFVSAYGVLYSNSLFHLFYSVALLWIVLLMAQPVGSRANLGGGEDESNPQPDRFESAADAEDDPSPSESNTGSSSSSPSSSPVPPPSQVNFHNVHVHSLLFGFTLVSLYSLVYIQGSNIRA